MRLQTLNLNLLVQLEVLLRTRNVTRAAEELHLSQSAVSTSLARLRTAFDDPLLVRQGRDLALSPYAQSLTVPLGEVLTRVEHILTDRPTFDPASAQRSFTVMASDYSTLIVLRPMLENLRREAPDVRFDIQPLRDDYADRVLRDEVDLLIVSDQLITGALTDCGAQHLYDDRFVLCGWRHTNPFAEPVTLLDLEGMPFIQYVTGDRLNLADGGLDTAGLVRKVEVRTESQLLVPYLLRGTSLVSLVPERLARVAQDSAELAYTDPPIALPPIRDTAVWHPRRTADPAHVWLRQRITSAAKSITNFFTAPQ